ncbi:hypothetical protein FRB99_001747 [Tulasnella sp. 403]|nr:hypothetical protein FRB99_001747 [Tulasnella sp. 403]
MLDVLKLSDLSPGATYAILSCVTLCDQSELVLGTFKSSAPLNRDQAGAIMTFAFKHVASLSPSYITVKMTDEYCALDDGHEKEWGVTLSCVQGETIEDLVHLAREHFIAAAPGLHNLCATLHIHVEDIADLLPIMNDMNDLLDITQLVLVAPLQMSALESFVHPSPSGRWLFPNLHELTVLPFGPVIDETLPNLVQARWEASRKAKRGKAKPDVVPIGDLYIHGEGSITRDAHAWLEKTKFLEFFDIAPEILLV